MKGSRTAAQGTPGRAAADAGSQGVQSVRRALAVLRLVATGQEQGVRLTDIATMSGLSRPTVHRLLRVLMEETAVEQDASTRRYLVGHELSLLGLARTDRFPLRAIAEPYLAGARRRGRRHRVPQHASRRRLGVHRAPSRAIDPIQVLSINLGVRRPLGAQRLRHRAAGRARAGHGRAIDASQRDPARAAAAQRRRRAGRCVRRAAPAMRTPRTASCRAPRRWRFRSTTRTVTCWSDQHRGPGRPAWSASAAGGARAHAATGAPDHAPACRGPGRARARGADATNGRSRAALLRRIGRHRSLHHLLSPCTASAAPKISASGGHDMDTSMIKGMALGGIAMVVLGAGAVTGFKTHDEAGVCRRRGGEGDHRDGGDSARALRRRSGAASRRR